MKKMSEKELRKLDAWIAEHAMGWTRVGKIATLDRAGRFYYRPEIGEVFIHKRGNEVCYFHPTTDPAAAMRVLEKCAEKTEPFECMYFGKVAQGWLIGLEQLKIEVESDTFPLAIALFAQKIFSK